MYVLAHRASNGNMCLCCLCPIEFFIYYYYHYSHKPKLTHTHTYRELQHEKEWYRVNLSILWEHLWLFLSRTIQCYYVYLSLDVSNGEKNKQRSFTHPPNISIHLSTYQLACSCLSTLSWDWNAYEALWHWNARDLQQQQQHPNNVIKVQNCNFDPWRFQPETEIWLSIIDTLQVYNYCLMHHWGLFIQVLCKHWVWHKIYCR